MFVFNFKLKRSKKLIAAAAAAVLLGAVCAVCVSGGGSNKKEATSDEAVALAKGACESFLTDLGYSVKGLENEESVIIPEEFNAIYENYNSIQELSGFDLNKYKGKTAEKLTYSVSGADAEFAVLLCENGKVIGGHLTNGEYGGEEMPLRLSDGKT